MDLLTLLATAYVTFGAGLLVASYLLDDLADDSPLEQAAVAIALIMAWPGMLALVGYAAWRNR
jgi:hypothetical protein